MKALCAAAVLAIGAGMLTGCTPDWATENNTPYIMEIASIDPNPMRSDVGFPITNDDATVAVNILRKNNLPGTPSSPIEHIYLEKYEIRYFRTDGRNTPGVDVPHPISGPLNVRFHTPGPGGGGEVENDFTMTIVRHQAKMDPPLSNLRGLGVFSVPNIPTFAGPGVITCIAEITIYGRTIQGGVLRDTAQMDITFADFPDEG